MVRHPGPTLRLADTVHRLRDLTTHQRTGKDEDGCTGQAGNCVNRLGQILLTHERNRIHRYSFPADVVPVCFIHRPHCNLRDLCTAANDDHTGSEYPAERGVNCNIKDAGEFFQIPQKSGAIIAPFQLKVKRCLLPERSVGDEGLLHNQNVHTVICDY